MEKMKNSIKEKDNVIKKLTKDMEGMESDIKVLEERNKELERCLTGIVELRNDNASLYETARELLKNQDVKTLWLWEKGHGGHVMQKV